MTEEEKKAKDIMALLRASHRVSHRRERETPDIGIVTATPLFRAALFRVVSRGGTTLSCSRSPALRWRTDELNKRKMNPGSHTQPVLTFRGVHPHPDESR